MEIVVGRSYDAPAIPGWFAKELHRIMPDGQMVWNKFKLHWELWRQNPNTGKLILGEGPLTRWCTETGEFLPLNQALLNHIQKSIRLGQKATEEFFDQLERENAIFQAEQEAAVANQRTEAFIKRHDLATNKLGGCRVAI